MTKLRDFLLNKVYAAWALFFVGLKYAVQPAQTLALTVFRQR